eukprot:scaffold1525_cov142-Cylindrotheca_fusiformis.AAC.97
MEVIISRTTTTRLDSHPWFLCREQRLESFLRSRSEQCGKTEKPIYHPVVLLRGKPRKGCRFLRRTTMRKARDAQDTFTGPRLRMRGFFRCGFS